MYNIKFRALQFSLCGSVSLKWQNIRLIILLVTYLLITLNTDFFTGKLNILYEAIATVLATILLTVL